jgi:hypothetical protein
MSAEERHALATAPLPCIRVMAGRPSRAGTTLIDDRPTEGGAVPRTLRLDEMDGFEEEA